ncbi:Acg family FMN-binding oxidoreductase [Cohaesibacter gelatinilyticus]|uniref:Nitroreductase family protein n=1 Tax=Cohaesibacter gelatinilyticus TaxID=372072 RepID=A0A285PI15_9HYPH|nr:nitroreductase family protein [Cohaesibacter gelatinilyticus]SNZ21068.1 Nitroreductase family protein [Cohaesibacter gelatinilyticus]
MHSRRKMIGLIGGGVVLAAGVSIGGFLTTRRPNRALVPWEQAGSYNEPRKRALSYAVLAPNSHNRQPWIAELKGEDRLLLYRDKSLNLPETDPFDRQLTVSMGCFLELLRMAAAQDGFALKMDLFPEGEEGPVADVTFVDGGKKDPLFAHVLHRHTNREAYEDRPVPVDAVETLSEFAKIEMGEAEVEALRQVTWEAMEIEMTTEATLMENVNLMRFGKVEIEANPDGISLGGPLLESLMVAGMLSREGQADRTSDSFKQGQEILHTAMMATPAYAVITTVGNTRVEQIKAGYSWMRLQLTATGLGLSMQPVSQALQEYPEMKAHYEHVHKMLAGPGETLQMLGRLGYGPAIDPSPRWPLETRIRNV